MAHTIKIYLINWIFNTSSWIASSLTSKIIRPGLRQASKKNKQGTLQQIKLQLHGNIGVEKLIRLVSDKEKRQGHCMGQITALWINQN